MSYDFVGLLTESQGLQKSVHSQIQQRREAVQDSAALDSSRATSLAGSREFPLIQLPKKFWEPAYESLIPRLL